jgi:phosphoglycolate phosphatase
LNRLALFDCDGTLVDSQHNIRRALENCFAGFGVEPPPAEQTRRVVGLSLVEAMAALLPDQTPQVHGELAERYKAAFQQMRHREEVEEPLYEGIAELLDALETDGWLLGVATGKSDRGLGLCLACHGWDKRFVTLQTADRHPSKPHPSMVETAMAEAGAGPETTMMIGDTSFDIAMARAAGVSAIGVAWGYHEPAELWSAGAHHVAERPGEVLEWARRSA